MWSDCIGLQLHYYRPTEYTGNVRRLQLAQLISYFTDVLYSSRTGRPIVATGFPTLIVRTLEYVTACMVIINFIFFQNSNSSRTIRKRERTDRKIYRKRGNCDALQLEAARRRVSVLILFNYDALIVQPCICCRLIAFNVNTRTAEKKKSRTAEEGKFTLYLYIRFYTR